MEDFRISNFLAHDVAHYGQDKAEEGAEVAADGGDGGSMAGQSYDFEEEQRQLAQEQENAVTEDESDSSTQDDDSTTVMISNLDRDRVLADDSGLVPALSKLRGQQYYKHSSSTDADAQPNVDEGAQA